MADYDPPQPSTELDIVALSAAVATAKRHYQACRYAQVSADLGPLLAQLRAATTQADGDDALRVHTLAADAYQVAASVLVKLGDVGLATLAADRSMAAATRSDDPLVVAASARAITHALMSGGHHRHAARTAVTIAGRLGPADRTTAEAVSVYGSLLLRGAVAAARGDDRHVALQLLDEAQDAADQLGSDGNRRWTAFGPTNVLLHRVNIAVVLGDAGQAIDYARRVDPDRIALTERRACLFIDVSRAYVQRGRHEQAYRALRAAEDTAAEEVRARRSVHRLVTELCHSAPRSLQPRVRQFAERIGVNS